MKNGVGVDVPGDPQNENILETNTINSTTTNEIQTNEVLEIPNTDSIENQNIGGENIKEVEIIEETIPLSQMQQDAKDILETKSLIIPLKGTVTSRFGIRDPETPSVPKNHTGIDIAANEGTVFVASMSGVVEEVSSKRRLRKSFKNS